ncbi:MAG: hypothetical protein ACR2ND_13485 [Solirubrobacteraceae bacterium]
MLVAACGSSSNSSSTSKSPGADTTSTAATAAPVPLSLSITQQGKTATITAPASSQGGLVRATLANKSKAPHSAQFFLLQGNHTAAQVYKLLLSNSNKTPNWLHAAGGVAQVDPGQTGSATVKLEPGHYVVGDLPAGGPPSGPLPKTDLTVTAAAAGNAALPATATAITAANPSKDHYKWEVSGPLTHGVNRVTFVSKGKSAIHLLLAARLTGNPSSAQILKGLASHGPPPAFFDQTSFAGTAVLDGGRSEVTELTLPKPGRYVLFCPLTDRDGGKEHFKEGLVKVVTVQ